jgi:hypothetical protein
MSASTRKRFSDPGNFQSRLREAGITMRLSPIAVNLYGKRVLGVSRSAALSIPSLVELRNHLNDKVIPRWPVGLAASAVIDDGTGWSWLVRGSSEAGVVLALFVTGGEPAFGSGTSASQPLMG